MYSQSMQDNLHMATSTDLVHMMALSLMSSDQIRAHQSPTVKKFYKKVNVSSK